MQAGPAQLAVQQGQPLALQQVPELRTMVPRALPVALAPELRAQRPELRPALREPLLALVRRRALARPQAEASC